MKKHKINKITGVIKELRHPFTTKIIKEVYVNGKGLYRRNNIYKNYNSIKTNKILLEQDLNKINWNKSI